MTGKGSTRDFPSKIRNYSDRIDGKGCTDFFFLHFCSTQGIGCIIIVFKPEQPKDLSVMSHRSVNPESSQLPARSVFCLEMLSLGGVLGQMLYFPEGKKTNPAHAPLSCTSWTAQAPSVI